MGPRSFWRKLAVLLVATGTIGVAQGATVIVTTTADGVAGSLRTAIQNAVSGDTIVFQIPASDPGYDPNTGYYVITLTGATDANKTLVINKSLTIDGGSGRPIVVRRGNNAPTDFGVFEITSGVVTMARIWISNGNLTTAAPARSFGAGIKNFGSGKLTVRECTFTGNAVGQGGGAIFSAGSLSISRSTFSANLAQSGGAIGGVSVLVESSTFTLNSAVQGGAIFHNSQALTIKSCTIYGNSTNPQGQTPSAGGGLYVGGGTVVIQNTIIAGNTASSDPEVSGVITSQGHNLIGSITSNPGFTATGDQVGVTPALVNLFPLNDYGGFNFTMPPKPGSFALDKGKTSTDANGQLINTDQRGQPRPVDRAESNASGGDGADIGAAELGVTQTGPFTVTTTAEKNDGFCTADDCSLVEALNVANAVDDVSTINFAPGVLGVIKTSSITPLGLAITAPVIINGPGARNLTIFPAGAGRAFRVTSPNVQISGLAVAGGVVNNDNGGGIHNTGGLTLTDCAIANSSSAANGGGLYNGSGATLALVRCTISQNGAAQTGGGLYNDGNVTATNCTISGSHAAQGGAIYSSFNNNASKVSLRNCTITNCTSNATGTAAGDGGGGLYMVGNNGQYNLGNCIVAGNFSSASPPTNPDLRGNFTSDGHNFIGNVGFSTGLVNNDAKADQVGTSGQPIDPKLDTLKNNGGPTDTHALLSNSSPTITAINKGDGNLAPATDQRGFPRVGVSDIGAFEFGSVGPGLVANVATRLPVGTGGDALFEGFTVQGPPGSIKRIIVRAIGPALIPFGIPDALVNPTLEIHDASTATVAVNNDWKSTQLGGLITGNQVADISGTGLAPSNDLESAIIVDLVPGSYTAVVRGVGDATGTGVVDAYDLSGASAAKLVNVATRGLIQPGAKLMIAGLSVQSGSVRLVVRAIGPSLFAFGINNALSDTTLQLRDPNGVIVRENDNWRTDQQQELIDTGLQPSEDLEAALVTTIPPGQYTAQVRGKNEATGVGVVQVYFLQ